MSHSDFVPLRIFSSFTMLDGATEPKDIAARARELGFPAAALTDRNGLYAAMAYSDACKKSGVQPIIGTMLGVIRPDMPHNVEPVYDWLALYAQNEAGYANLCTLVSAAHLDRPLEAPPHISFDFLAKHSDGLIALTAGNEGGLTRLLAEEQMKRAAQYADRLQTLFPDRLYIEIIRRLDAVEGRAEPHLLDMAYDRNLPIVATNPCCYMDRDFHEAHDALLCIASSSYVDSSDDRTRSSPDAWMKPAREMRALFHDLPEALENTITVAQRCAVMAPYRSPILPSLAGDREGEAIKLREDAHAGLTARLRKLEAVEAVGIGSIAVPDALDVQGDLAKQNVISDLLALSNRAALSANGNADIPVMEEPLFAALDSDAHHDAQTDAEVLILQEKYRAYYDRLDFELDIIIQMGFPGYFLIVADFIKWAKDNDIPVGPGRGSGAGSVVAWSLTITDLDPMKLGLLFERFLNPERVSMPDFDIDFCETRREEVIRYVQKKYGRDHVAQIITFGRLKARAVLKDTGRVLQMSYGQVDRLAKLVPNLPTDPWTLDRAINGVSELAADYKNDGEVRRLLDLAMKLEGLPRHSSTHAAGVVIGDRPLHQLVPLYRDPRSDMPVTQFDMKYVEAAGLVKFDFLGLKTLSVMQKAVQMLAKRGVVVDLETLHWEDEAVYALLQRGDTVGVFQLESEGMRRTLAAVRPSNFGDIIALGALYRPGPMDNIPMFGARKNGREPIEYPHDLLEPILSETYGVFVYQEQVMQAAQILAGYSLGEADLLRRAMGKKIKSEMDAQRERFVSGCAVHAIKPAKANELFDLIDKFAGYGFNKSHAAAYALLSYQTAWLKAHYPAEFFAASMCYDMTLTDKLSIFTEDMRRMSVPCLPPCINHSEAEFTVEPTEEGLAVRYALAALKGVGEKAMEALVSERGANGPFADIDDFANRVDPRVLNRRQMESIAGSGGFDAINPNRAGVFAVSETMLAVASNANDARNSGQHGLFGGDEAKAAAIQLPNSAIWSLADRMSQEKEAFGFYFSAHPIDRYRHLATAHGARSYGEYCAQPATADGGRVPGMMAGLIEDIRWRTSAKGRRYLMATCSDASGQFIASCFDDQVSTDLEDTAREGGCALLTVELDRRAGEETPRVTIKRVQAFESLAGSARLILEITATDPAVLPLLKSMVSGEQGGRGELLLNAQLEDGISARVCLGRHYILDGELEARIENLPGILSISLRAADSARLALVS